MKLTQKLGDRFIWPIPLVRLDGSAIDPTGCSVIFTAKLKPTSQSDADAAFQKSLEFGITITGDSSAGYVANVDVLPLNTQALSPGLLSCDVQVQNIADPDIVASTPTHTLALIRDVTRETVTSVDIHTEQAPAPGPFIWNNIAGKPEEFPPESHAASHGSSGSDPLTPAAIGAETPAGAQARADAVAAQLAAHRIGDLADVALSAPQHGDRIAYNAGADRWENSSVTDGGFF